MPRSPGSRAYIDLIKRKLEPNKTHFLETRLSKNGSKTSPHSAYGMRARPVRNVIGEEEIEDSRGMEYCCDYASSDFSCFEMYVL